MEGYLWKRRFYCGQKKGNLRRRYCILDAEKEVVLFKTTKEEENCHKHVELEEISHVLEYGDHGMLIIFRHVATHETCGAAFLFEVCTDGIAEGMSQQETRDKWVQMLKNRIDAKNDGLDLVVRNTESIHAHYKVKHSPKNLLGSGISGDVRRIERKRDGKAYAMKTICLSGIESGTLGALRREIDILKSLDHPHIVRLHETFIEPKLYCRLVLELCEGGELFHRMKCRGHFSERYAGKLIATMLKALNYIHTNLIVHRDLKLENWLFWRPESSRNPEDNDIGLVDFGLSRRLRSTDEEMTKKVGTCYYVAPEVIAGSYRGTSCDMWSLGVISYMLLCGSAPFEAIRDNEITKKVLNRPVPNIREKKGIWEGISSECKDFVLGLLEKDPSQRLDAKGALNHSWVRNIFRQSEESPATEEVPEHKIDNTVLMRLRNFAKYKELKRVAMEVIAFSLDHNEIKELTELFEEIDTDHDGYIKLEELVTALKDYDNLNRDEVEEIFNALDEDHNGKVHVNEFVAGTLQAKYHLEEEFLRSAFQRLDVGKKGKINLEDLKRVLGKCGSTERILSIWEQSGICKDGEISKEEFFRFMRSDGEKNIQEYRRASATPEKVAAEGIREVELLDVPRVPKLRKRSGQSSNSRLSTKSFRKLPVGRMRRLWKSSKPKPALLENEN